MRLVSLLGLSLAVIGGGACAAAVQEPEVASPAPALTGVLRASDGSEVGRVTGWAGPSGWLFRIEGQGWPAGWHGAHLHSVGDCAAPGFQSAGGHLNHADHPHPHGLLNPGGPDLGDLPNVHAHADGSARAEFYWAAPVGEVPDFMDADGIALVIHANADDHVSQPIGGAGARIACAVLQPAGD